MYHSIYHSCLFVVWHEESSMLYELGYARQFTVLTIFLTSAASLLSRMPIQRASLFWLNKMNVLYKRQRFRVNENTKPHSLFPQLPTKKQPSKFYTSALVQKGDYRPWNIFTDRAPFPIRNLEPLCLTIWRTSSAGSKVNPHSDHLVPLFQRCL